MWLPWPVAAALLDERVTELATRHHVTKQFLRPPRNRLPQLHSLQRAAGCRKATDPFLLTCASIPRLLLRASPLQKPPWTLRPS